jgi:hypothetical protein
MHARAGGVRLEAPRPLRQAGGSVCGGHACAAPGSRGCGARTHGASRGVLRARLLLSECVVMRASGMSPGAVVRGGGRGGVCVCGGGGCR